MTNRKSMIRGRLLMTAAMALTAGLPSAVLAQEEPSTGQDNAVADAAVEETFGSDIVVRAQGRDQRLLDVPIAVSAVTAEALEQTGATDIRELTQIAPSLQVSSTGSEANGSARVRGIGTVGDNPGLESSVAVFIDGVYRSRSGIGLSELGEIDSVEVLRGPQGTLFGRNASAGLINIRSKAPEFEFGANGEFSYGNFDYIRGQIGVTGPISDQLAARLDAIYVKRDGFYNDVVNDEDVNNRDRYFIKGQLLFEPTDTMSFRLIGDYTKRDEACCAAVYLNPQESPTSVGLTDPAFNPIIRVLDLLGQPDEAYSDPYSRDIFSTPGRGFRGEVEDWGVSLEGTIDLGFAELTSITAYRDYRSDQGSDTDYGVPDLLYRADDGGSSRAFETFTQEFRLQGSAFDDRLDWLVGAYFSNEDLTVRDNLRFGEDYGRFANCRIFAGGGFNALLDVNGPFCLNAAFGEPTVDGATGTPDVAEAFKLLDQVNDVGSTSDRYFQNSRNFAFFTHNIVKITDQLNLTLGLRYTNELKRFEAEFGNDNIFCPQVQALVLDDLSSTNATTRALAGAAIGLACQGNSTAELDGVTLKDRRSESEFTGTAVLSYKPTDDLLLYGSYSRGYKAGGFNLDRSALKSPILPFAATPGGAQALVGNLQFAAETVNAYELGAKYSNRMFSLSVAAFRQDFANFQLNTFNGSVFLVQNINGCSEELIGGSAADNDQASNPDEPLFNSGAALTGLCGEDDTGWGVRSEGVEMEASLRPHRDINVGIGVTYVETKYRDELVGRDDGQVALDPALRVLPGNNLSNAPEITVTTSFAWTPELGSSGLSALFYVDQRTTSDYNTGSDLFPQKAQDGFTVVNARVGLGDSDGAWGIELWAKNLFDTDYTQVAFNSPFQASTNFVPPSGSFANYPGDGQIFSAFLAEPRTYGVTVRGRF